MLSNGEEHLIVHLKIFPILFCFFSNSLQLLTLNSLMKLDLSGCKRQGLVSTCSVYWQELF